jgi:hypothetical protein
MGAGVRGAAVGAVVALAATCVAARVPVPAPHAQPPNSEHLWSAAKPASVLDVPGTSAWKRWLVVSYLGQAGLPTRLGLPAKANWVQ